MPDQLNNQPVQEKLGLYGLGDYNTGQIKAFARFAEIEDLNPKNYYDRRPDAAPSPQQYIKAMKPETVSLIVPDAFAGQMGIELLENMTLEQLRAIGTGQNPVLKLAIKNTLNRLLESAGERRTPQIEEIYRYLVYSPAWQF